jgi:hypothetical protein
MNKYIIILTISLIAAIVAIIAPSILTKYISDSLDIAFIVTILLTFCGLIIWSVSGLIIAIIELLKKK